MTCARRLAGARRPAASTPAGSARPEPLPGHRRARLSRFLPALALLLGALSLFHSTPASAQVWSATLTVASATYGNGCGAGSSGGPCSDALTEDEFTHGTLARTVTRFQANFFGSNDYRIEFGLSGRTGAQVKTDLSGLTLNIGAISVPGGTTYAATAYAIDDATVVSGFIYWQISQRWNNGDAAFTVAVSLTDVPRAPAAPTGLTILKGGAKLDLSWTPPSGTLTGYDVHYTSAVEGTVGNEVAASGSNPSAGWVAVSRGTEADPPTASQTISSLSNGTLYRVRVRAKNAIGDGAWVFGTGTPAVPTVEFGINTLLLTESDTTPENIVVLLSSAQAQSVTVGISVVAAETTATAADYTLSATSVTFAAGQTSKTFTILGTADMMAEGSENETLRLRLTPPAGIGLGFVTDVDIVIVDDSLPAPTLTVTPGNLSLALTWTDPVADASGGSDGWDVHYTSAAEGTVGNEVAATGTDAAAAWVAVTRTGTARSQMISSLSNGTTYRLRVRWFALNAAMDMRTESGDWIFGTGRPKGPPAAPADLALSGQEESLEVTWTASTSTGNAAPTYYEVAFDVATMTVTNLRYTARTTSGTATSLTIDDSSSALDILEATQYRATIRACNPVCSSYAGDQTAWTSVRVPSDAANLTVTPGNAQLSLSWTLDTDGEAAATGYEVAYTASTTVSSNANVGTDPATEWVDAGHSGTGTSYTITGLTNDQEYQVRVTPLRVVNSAKSTGGETYGTGTPRAAPTVSLEVTETVSEGDYPVRIIAELSEPSASDVQVQLTLTLDTAELADFAAGSGVVFDAGASPVTGTRSLTVPAGEYNAEFEIATVHDTDGEDETFTVAIDTNNLPTGYIAGSPTSAQVTIDDDETRNPDPDLLTGLTINDGMRELYFDANTAGNQVGLGGPDAIYTVQVNPGIRSVTVTPAWTNSAITRVNGTVRYITYGRDGAPLTWDSGESGTGKVVVLQAENLSAQGTTELTLTVTRSVDGVTSTSDYRILFQHNFDWENANNRLSRLVMQASQ